MIKTFMACADGGLVCVPLALLAAGTAWCIRCIRKHKKKCDEPRCEVLHLVEDDCGCECHEDHGDEEET